MKIDLKRIPRQRLIALVLWVIVVLLGVVWVAVGIPLRSAREAILAGRPEDAAGRLRFWARLRLRPEDFDQLLSAAYLLMGERDSARPWLERSARRSADLLPAISKAEAGKLFLSRGLYDEFLAWDSAVRQRFEPEEVELYRAAARASLGRLDEAAASAASIRRSRVDRERLAALEAAIARRREGSYPLLLDATGQPIAVWQMLNRDLVAVNSDFAPLVESAGGALTVEATMRGSAPPGIIETTLDARVQRAALDALGTYRGSIVAVDPRSGALLAVASSNGAGEMENLAFSGLYEPGGAMAPVTAMAAVESGKDAIFPTECEGVAEFAGTRFHDWAAHGEIASLEETFAVSCQLTLARLGVASGWPSLEAILARLRFGESVDLGLMTVPLGSLSGPVENPFAVAQAAAGSETVRVSSLHLALIGASVANGGTMTLPRLVRGRRTILGDAIGAPSDRLATRVAGAAAAERAAAAMTAPVTHPRGLARSAVSPDVPNVAVATGIGGNPLGGYDAIAIGFAPAEEPVVAFGLVAEDAGGSASEAAAILHRFLVAFPFE